MTVSVREQVDALYAEWAWQLDHHEYDAVAQLFTEDALFIAGSTEVRGRNGIRDRYARRTGDRTTRHTYSGLRLEGSCATATDATSVWISWAVNAPAPVDEVAVYLVADFHDQLVSTDDGRWLISRRRIVPVFRNAAAGPGPA